MFYNNYLYYLIFKNVEEIKSQLRVIKYNLCWKNTKSSVIYDNDLNLFIKQ